MIFFVGLAILWVVVSLPVYFAGKAITGGRAYFGQAMRATLGGVIAYFVVYFVIAFFLRAVLPASANFFALILGFIVWLAVYRASFKTSWIGAVGIVGLAWIILLFLDFVLVHSFGITFPDFFPF